PFPTRRSSDLVPGTRGDWRPGKILYIIPDHWINTQRMDMLKLTPRQVEILAFINHFLEQHGFPPTRAEIAQKLVFKSPNAAEEHLKALARKGAIERIRGASRGIRLPADSEPLGRDDALPVLGQAAPGAPIPAVENIEDHCRISPDLRSPRADHRSPGR